jgi:ComF family protein
LFEFNGLGRAIIYELKYNGGHFLLPDIGRISRHLFSDLRGKILVPVPLHWMRKWRRGYNQSEAICTALAAEHGCSIAKILRRKKLTQRQVGLGRYKRMVNVEGAFALRLFGLPWKKIDKNAEIYLIDDVLTTGATMDACATVLRDAGFCKIHARTLAHG